MNFITIDGGTTNTRIYLVTDGKIADSVKIKRGTNSIIARAALRIDIRNTLTRLLSDNGLDNGDIERIIVSGMLTSELGIYTVEHTALPAGIDEVAKGSREVTLPDISPIPFLFISGLKTAKGSELDFNTMRGEETELFGIMSSDKEALYILPGSHSKIIKVDREGKVTDFLSTLTGEMIASLSGHTIISECLDITAGAPSRSALREGFIFAGEHGINEALFKPRALKISGNRDNAYIYGFFMGAVLCDEIKSINALSEKRVVIGGRREIKEAMAYLLSEFSDKEITVLDEETVAYSTVKGAIRIFERKRELQ